MERNEPQLPEKDELVKISLPINWPDELFVEPKKEVEKDRRVIPKPNRDPLKIPVIQKAPSGLEEYVVEKDDSKGPILNKIIENIKVDAPDMSPLEAKEEDDPLFSLAEKESDQNNPLEMLDRDMLEKMEIERQARDEKRRERRQRAAKKRSSKETKKIRRLARKRNRQKRKEENKTLIQKTLNQPVGYLLEKTPVIGPFLIDLKKKQKSKPKKKGPGLRERISKKIKDIKIARMQRLQRNIVGLEITESSIRAVRIKNDKMTIAETSLPPGIIVDGLLEESEELSEEIKKFWKENKIDSNQVNFSISNRLTKLSVVSVPAKTKEDALQALVMSVGEIIEPMETERSIIDYHELGRSNKNFNFQVIAADKEMVRKFIGSIEKAGLYAVSCEISAVAAARVFAIPRGKNIAHMMIQMNSETTSISVLNGQDVLFMRNISVGTRDFSLAIQKSIGCSIFEADIIRDQVGLKQGALTTSIDKDIASLGRDSLRVVADNLFQEISQTKRFFENQPGGKKITSWSLVGEGALIDGLEDQMGIFVSLPGAGQTAPWPGFESVSNLSVKSASIGLATEHDTSLIPRVDFSGIRPVFRKQSKINLNQSEKAAKELARSHGLVRPKYSPRLFGIALAALIFLGGFYMKGNLSSENESMRQEILRFQEGAAQQTGSGLTPSYQGPESALLGDVATKIIVQPNQDLTDDIVKFLATSKIIDEYSLVTSGGNYEIEVSFRNEEDPIIFEKELKQIRNIGSVTVSGKTTNSLANPKITYSAGGYTGVGGNE